MCFIYSNYQLNLETNKWIDSGLGAKGDQHDTLLSEKADTCI